jgi:hypothetical protein
MAVESLQQPNLRGHAALTELSVALERPAGSRRPAQHIDDSRRG